MRVPFTESLDKVFKANTLRPAKLLRVVPIAVAALTSQSIVLKTDFPAKHRNPVREVLDKSHPDRIGAITNRWKVRIEIVIF